ncbi:PEP-CTERM sorting domain-containing protein [Verrucomicrobiaceae bacterium 227]
MKKYLLSSAVLGAALLGNSSAAIMSFDFSATVPNLGTSFDGSMIVGTVSYDDAIINPAAPTEFNAPNASITVSAFGQNFTESDDLEAGTFPVLTLSPAPMNEWAFTLIIAESGGPNPVVIDAPGIEGFEINLDPVASGESSYPASVVVTPSSVPEPGSAMLALLGMMTLGSRRRRQS